MLADHHLDPAQLPNDGRFVIRPARSMVNLLRIGLGAVTSITAGACLLNGALVPALICIGIGAFAYYVVVGARLWVDAERVGCSGPLQRGSCRRDELEFMMIGYRNRCRFIRRDGRTAFQAPGKLFGNDQLKALADYLGVPIYGGAFGFPHVAPPGQGAG